MITGCLHLSASKIKSYVHTTPSLIWFAESWKWLIFSYLFTNYWVMSIEVDENYSTPIWSH